MPLHLLQLTDLHVLADEAGTVLGCAPRPALRAVLAAARPQPADVVLLTGDLSQDGSARSYAALGPLLRPLGAPCYWMPGNHDAPRVMARALAAAPFRADRSFAAGGWRFLLLDSTVPGETHGRLSSAALGWLSGELAAHAHVPTLIALHHPPVPPGAAWLGPLGLRRPGALLDLVAAHPHVRLVLFGHIHQELHARHAQAHLYACPPTCFQFEPHAETFAIGRAPAGYRRLQLFPDGSFTTAVEHVPHAFAANPEAAGY